MSGRLDRIARCLELADEDIADAMESRQATTALLEHLASISAPDTGVAKVLIVYARMATTACDWIDGDLRVELTADGLETIARVATEMGGGLLERALPAAVYRVPIEEFGRAIDRVPRLIAPLAIHGRTAGRIVLSATELVRRTSAPPPAIEIAVESLFVRIPAAPGAPVDEDRSQLPVVSVPPGSLDDGWD